MGKHVAALEQLSKKRSRLALILTAILLCVFGTFIGLIAFNKPLAAQLVKPGLSLGILLGVATFLTVWVITLIYVYWSNTYYDQAIARIKEMRPHKE